MDRYRLIEPLGTGGMSVVWRAFDEVLGRAVAIKLLAPKLLDDPRSRQRIQAEARAAALLSHPHIAAVHDFGHDDDGAPFVVMELVTGHSLEDRLAAGPLPANEALRLGAQLASALGAVHARGLVHRDVKPANVMLTTHGAKLVDFGISAVAGDTTDLHDELLGTPAYLAPERLHGLPTTAATDVYALGLLLYRVLTGRLPWPADTTTAMLHAHRLTRPAPLPTELAIAKRPADAILRCLAKAPENRPSAEDMHQVLAVPVPPVPRPATPTRRLASALPPRLTRGRMVAAGVVVVALGGLSMCSTGSPKPTWTAAGANPAAPARTAADCLVRYTVRNEQAGAFAAELDLTNTGAASVQAWTLDFRLPEDQALGSAGGLTWRQDGADVHLTGAAPIAAGGSQQVALSGSYRSPQALPTGFALNGTGCQQVLVAAAAPASVPTTAASAVTGAPAGGPPAHVTGGPGRPKKTRDNSGKGNQDDG